MGRPLALTVITRIIHTLAHRTATTDLSGSRVTCSSARALGITGITATQAGMAVAGAATGIATVGAGADSDATGTTMGGGIMMAAGDASSTVTEDFTMRTGSAAVTSMIEDFAVEVNSTEAADSTAVAGFMAVEATEADTGRQE